MQRIREPHRPAPRGVGVFASALQWGLAALLGLCMLLTGPGHVILHGIVPHGHDHGHGHGHDQGLRHTGHTHPSGPATDQASCANPDQATVAADLELERGECSTCLSLSGATPPRPLEPTRLLLAATTAPSPAERAVRPVRPRAWPPRGPPSKS